ncbi:MAG: membrane carboxypeptidase/penicillin-binding protein PbpC [Ulvibacter sp.]
MGNARRYKNWKANLDHLVAQKLGRKQWYRWYLNENYLGSTQTFHEIALAPTPGIYQLTATDQEENKVKQAIEILRASD